MTNEELARLLGTNEQALMHLIDGLADDRLNNAFQRRVIMRRACGRPLDLNGDPIADPNAPTAVKPADKMRELERKRLKLPRRS